MNTDEPLPCFIFGKSDKVGVKASAGANYRKNFKNSPFRVRNEHDLKKLKSEINKKRRQLERNHRTSHSLDDHLS